MNYKNHRDYNIEPVDFNKICRIITYVAIMYNAYETSDGGIYSDYNQEKVKKYLGYNNDISVEFIENLIKNNPDGYHTVIKEVLNKEDFIFNYILEEMVRDEWDDNEHEFYITYPQLTRDINVIGVSGIKLRDTINELINMKSLMFELISLVRSKKNRRNV
jgi:hypothetical protein